MLVSVQKSARLAAFLPLYGLLYASTDLFGHYDVLALGVAWALFVHGLPALGRAAPRLLTAAMLFLCCCIAYRQLYFGASGRHALVGGIVPWSDAGGFLSDALSKVYGGEFSPHSIKRPVYPTLLAAALRVTGGHLPGALALFAAPCFALAGLVTAHIFQSHGPRAASFVGLLLVIYLRRYVFTVGTEPAGFLFGACAFLLSRKLAVPEHAGPRVALIFAFFCFGLLARAGPMFAWLGIGYALWQMPPAFLRRRAVAVWALAASVVTTLCNSVMVRTMGEGRAFGDYPPIFYGMIHGEDFTYLAIRHPELNALRGDALQQATSQIIRLELMAEPWRLPLGMLRSALAAVFSPHGLFSLIFYTPDDSYFERGGPLQALALFVQQLSVYRLVNLAAMALLGLGVTLSLLVVAWRLLRAERRSLLERLDLYVLVGALASTCFTPPWITECSQLQAVTVCFLASLSARVFSTPQGLGESKLDTADLALWPASVALALVPICYAWVQYAPVSSPVTRCDMTPQVQVLGGTRVTVGADGAHGYNWRRYSENVSMIAKRNRGLSVPLEQHVQVGSVIAVGFDACTKSSRVLIDPSGTTLLGGEEGWRPLRYRLAGQVGVIDILLQSSETNRLSP